MRRARSVIIAAAVAAACGGCGTVANIAWIGPELPPPDHGRVYGGVVADLGAARKCAADACHANDWKGFSRAAGEAAYFLVVDLPLSTAADTLTLPLTVTATLKKRNRASHRADSEEFVAP